MLLFSRYNKKKDGKISATDFKAIIKPRDFVLGFQLDAKRESSNRGGLLAISTETKHLIQAFMRNVIKAEIKVETSRQAMKKKFGCSLNDAFQCLDSSNKG